MLRFCWLDNEIDPHIRILCLRLCCSSWSSICGLREWQFTWRKVLVDPDT